MRTGPGTGHPVITGLLILVALGMIIQLLPRMGAVLAEEVAAVLAADADKRVAARWRRYRRLGLPG